MHTVLEKPLQQEKPIEPPVINDQTSWGGTGQIDLGIDVQCADDIGWIVCDCSKEEETQMTSILQELLNQNFHINRSKSEEYTSNRDEEE